MSSKILVDELAGKTAAGNITVTSEGGSATMQLQQGLAKAWITYNMSTAAVSDSLNVSSITDNSTGQFYVDKTNAFSNINHSITGSHSITAAGGDAWTSFIDYESVLAKTTTRHSQVTYSNGTYYDSAYATGHIQGDLA